MAGARLALVPGEPAGVGPELCVRAAARPFPAPVVAYGDPDALLRAARRLGLALQILDPDRPAGPGRLPLVPVPQARVEEPGRPDPANARAVVDALLLAAAACRAGDCTALVTGPVHKASINRGGIPYTGTTGLLADDAGVEVVMMLANPAMRVALATTHLPLARVPAAITRDGLSRTLDILHAALRGPFGLDSPRIAVLGLNPHAGEDGLLGDEEIEVIAPAIAAQRAAGRRVEGPLPADTAFLPGRLAGVDAVLAMYHDQGLPVLKHNDFANAVNITLGLPYPRVAVDHGTALDLAGTGRADPSSLFAALQVAATLAGPAAGAAA